METEANGTEEESSRKRDPELLAMERAWRLLAELETAPCVQAAEWLLRRAHRRMGEEDRKRPGVLPQGIAQTKAQTGFFDEP